MDERAVQENRGLDAPQNTDMTSSNIYKKALYKRMLEEFENSGIQEDGTISYEYFTSVWTEHLSDFITAIGNIIISNQNTNTTRHHDTALKTVRQQQP